MLGPLPEPSPPPAPRPSTQSPIYVIVYRPQSVFDCSATTVSNGHRLFIDCNSFFCRFAHVRHPSQRSSAPVSSRPGICWKTQLLCILGVGTRGIRRARVWWKIPIKPTAPKTDFDVSPRRPIVKNCGNFSSRSVWVRGGFVLRFARPVKTVRPLRACRSAGTLLENFTITYSTVDARTTTRKTSKLDDTPVGFVWNSRYFIIITKPI